MLPPRLVKLRQDRMDEREEDFYQALYTQSQAQFNTYLEVCFPLSRRGVFSM
jgi:DNA repair protein RAD16